jgi:hypothetical protein
MPVLFQENQPWRYQISEATVDFQPRGVVYAVMQLRAQHVFEIRNTWRGIQ